MTDNLDRPRVPVSPLCISGGHTPLLVTRHVWASPMAQSVKSLPAVQEMQETRVLSLSKKYPLEEERQPTPVFWPGEPHGRRSLEGDSPWGCKESDRTEQFSTRGDS